MTDIFTFEDIELWSASYLRGRLADDVFVGRDVPKETRPKMVTVRRQGGNDKNRVQETARIGVNVYAPTVKDANDLVALVRAYVTAAEGTDSIKRVRINGWSEIKDDTGLSRRYFTAELDVRGNQIEGG